MNAINSIYAATVTLPLTAMTAAMTNVCKVVEKKAYLPVLASVLVRENLGGLEFIGTDQDIVTTRFVHCKAPKGFVALLPAHKTLDILKRAKAADEVSMTLTENGVLVSIGELNINLDAPAEVGDFPVSLGGASEALAKTNYSFNMPTKLLCDALTKTIFAVSTEETRYYLNGVYLAAVDWRGSETTLDFVATDGHRLSRFTIPAPAGAGGIPGVIIPRKAASEILRIVKRKDCPEGAMISVAESGVSFLIGEDELVQTKTIDGTFPDYTRVIPTGNNERATLDPVLTRDALKQVSVISEERGRAVKLTFGEDRVKLTVTNPDAGSADMTIRCNANTINEIGINAKYLDEVMAMVEGHAEFRMDGVGNPVVIHDMADDRVTFVQMPMRV